MKLFVVMSVVYLFVGSLLGVLMVMDVNSIAIRFAHIHLNLLGFMAMMIFGVGYFIIPRFNARTLKWPGLVSVHFWLANITLISMVIFYTISRHIFAISALLQLVSIALFVTNLILSISGKVEALQKREERPREVPQISGEMKVAEIVERWPSVVNILVEEGLKAFSDPGHIENVKKLGITISMATKRHGIDEKRLLEKIASHVGGRVSGEAMPLKDDQIIGRESIIGDVLKAYPQTEEVFKRFYGEGCFSCPGQAYETIAQSALMHNVDEQEILNELNRKAKQSMM
jgi:hybrid cluster-associated redox disulfide protein